MNKDVAHQCIWFSNTSSHTPYTSIWMAFCFTVFHFEYKNHTLMFSISIFYGHNLNLNYYFFFVINAYRERRCYSSVCMEYLLLWGICAILMAEPFNINIPHQYAIFVTNFYWWEFKICPTRSKCIDSERSSAFYGGNNENFSMGGLYGIFQLK